ncbi:hypothetical protein ETAA8_29090 [Anatilimnocola aggregata]|uniref:Uncharacterized protein n=1 Tax=Anatilimnocola aggregata TaxID=2528021 RepID=A0A517YC49_9BACT|nr:hypothetical protein [Anatilimnocola aggregata]QDU27818.1 hypothetical protein ETAA8_29090 [Anatilimnocola aggregata]
MFGSRLMLILLGVVCWLNAGNSADAQRPGAKPMPKPGQARLVTITPEREATVTDFVTRNHPELAQLLSHLKANQPKEYERALRDLFRVTEKLAMVHERDSRQYDLELKAWQAQSRAQLLVARMKMGDAASSENEDLKEQLREILAEQWQARLDVLRLERERVTGRLGKLEEDISKLERDRDAVIEQHLKSLTSSGANSGKAKGKPLDKRPSERVASEKLSGEKASGEKPSPATSVKQPVKQRPE